MRVAPLAILVACVAACGGASTPTQRPSTAPPTTAPATTVSGTPAAPTSGPATTAPSAAGPSAGGGTTVTVILTGGPDAGTYKSSDNPLCSSGVVGTGVWGAQFSADGGPGQISVIQIVAPTAAATDTKLSALVSIGPLLTSTNYRLDDTTGSAQVTDNGTTAVIHVTGTTDEGVGVDLTVNCSGVLH